MLYAYIHAYMHIYIYIYTHTYIPIIFRIQANKGVLDQTTVFEKNKSKISLETKIKMDIGRNAAVIDSGNWNQQILKCRCP